jgi:hypothetical protein
MGLTRSETELTTAGTDLVLAVLCLSYARVLLATPAPTRWLQLIWAAVLLLMAAGALLGAVAHALEFSRRVKAVLWKALYLSLGMSVALVVVAAIGDWLGADAGRRWLPWAIGTGFGFFLLTELRGGGFSLFVAYEGASLLVASGMYAALALDHQPGAAMVAAGLLVSVAAGLVQLSRWRIRIGVPFDHNGLFHLVQLAGLVLIASGVRARLGS